MASDESDDERAIYRTIRELSEQLGSVREQMREDVTKLLADYRRDVHVTLLAIQKRLIEIDDAREIGQRHAHLFRWITVSLIAALIIINLLVLAYQFGRQAAGGVLATWGF